MDTEADWRARERLRQQDPDAAVVSVYARGRDYHKVLRNRLQQLAESVAAASANRLPRVHRFGAGDGTAAGGKGGPGLARQAHAAAVAGGRLDLLHRRDPGRPAAARGRATGAHCGQCEACIDACPTGAILGPGRLDARRCISYLTIELKGSIPEDLRPLIGNRIYGCDDCQLVCPWNKFAQRAVLPDFDERHGLGAAGLVELFAWEEEEFNRRMEGSPIRRIGHERWLRNLAVGLGNAAAGGPGDARIVAALRARLAHPSALVREHVAWALRATALSSLRLRCASCAGPTSRRRSKSSPRL